MKEKKVLKQTRKSQLIDISKYPSVKARQSLNNKLQKYSCGIDAKHNIQFTENEIEILAVIARERTNHNSFLRQQAISALGKLQTLNSFEVLHEIAFSKIEDDHVRGSAISELAETSPELSTEMIAGLLKHPSSAIRQYAVSALGNIGSYQSSKLIENHITLEKSPEVLRKVRELLKIEGKKKTHRKAKKKIPTKDNA